MSTALAQDLIASSDNRVVFGLGVTGLSCARYLYQQQLPFCVVDTREQPPGLEEMRAEMPDISVFTGSVPDELLLSASQLIVSPGVSLEQPQVVRAADAGADVIGDIDLFMQAATAPVVGITGSNAKSTVTALVGLMAEIAGKDVGVGGNLGTPALDLLSPTRELYIVELSSFQLERAAPLGLEVATVLNVSADHLDRHGNMPRYHQAKHRIFRGCSKVVVNRDDRLTVPLVDDSVQQISWRMSEPELGGFGLRDIEGREWLCHGFEALMPAVDIALPGRHNVANALAAMALAHSAGLPVAAMTQALQKFQSLPHRCQQVATINDVVYVNDSKGTNPGATDAALRGLGDGQNVLLIAGGEGKDADFSLLAKAVSAHCRQLLLIGADAEKIQAALEEFVPCTLAEDLESAVNLASELAMPGDLVLLSPACASFDMFRSYTQRGDVFVAAVKALSEAGS